jgi:hypothetical protein
MRRVVFLPDTLRLRTGASRLLVDVPTGLMEGTWELVAFRD